MGEKKRVLIVAKTYPLPSESYMELVCTGGVLEDGSFIRLYPINYRYRPYWEWYKKYQWIELEVERNTKDPRPESYRPVPEAKIRVIGDPLPSKKHWEARKRYVLAKGVSTMCELNSIPQDVRSMGIVRVKEVTDLIVEEDEPDWKPQWKKLFNELYLFGPNRKPLEKIPFKFIYAYTCEEPGCKGHRMMIEDWEVGQLYRAMRDKYGSAEVAVEKVRDKLLNQMCAPDIDTHFFVGTVKKYSTYVIVGVFWPKKIK